MKIFEEHEAYLKGITANQNPSKMKNYFYKIFEKNDNYPIIKNEVIRSRYESNNDNKINDDNLYKNNNEKNNSSISIFYKSVYKNETNFFKDFNTYLKFQMESPDGVKGKDAGKYEDLANKFSKILSGNSVNYYKIYSRCSLVK